MNESDCMEDERIEKNNIEVDLKVNTVETVDRLISFRSDTRG
jgi:hypothetical protein